MDDAAQIAHTAQLEFASWLEHGDWHGLAALIREDALRPDGPLLTPALVWTIMQSAPWTTRHNLGCWYAHFHLWWERANVTSWAHVSLLVDDHLVSVERLLVTSALWVKSLPKRNPSPIQSSWAFDEYHAVYCGLSWKDPVKHESVRFLATLTMLEATSNEHAWQHQLLTLLHPSKSVLIDTIWQSEPDTARVFYAALSGIEDETNDLALELPEEVD